MTPEGPRPDSSIVPIQGAPGYGMRVERGYVTVWKHHDKGEASWVQVAAAPAPVNYYWGPRNELIYLFPLPGRSNGRRRAVPASEVMDGKVWADFLARVPRRHREAMAFAIGTVINDKQPLTVSPAITEALPPLAPPMGPIPGSDSTLGHATWKWIAGRLSPLGKLTVGAALAAPWIKESGTAAPTLWTLIGEAGAGKTMLLKICASIYGDPEDWVHPFNTTNQGLSSLAQTHSYLPLMLDEAQGVTASLVNVLTPLIQGADRMRSEKTGAPSASLGSWHSLAFITSNYPLRDELKMEMWDRRLFEVEGDQLWKNRPSDRLAETHWWSEIGAGLRNMRGFVWQALNEKYAPGPDAIKWLHQAMESVNLPGGGSNGVVAQLAVAGCQWLAQWTGNPEWTEGVETAAIALCAECEELKTDPARDAAREIITHRAMQPQAWGKDDRDTVAYLGGYDGTCKIAHPDHPCEWVGLISKAWKVVCPSIPVARVRNTAFRQALAPGDGRNLTRRWRVPSSFSNAGMIRAYVMCWHALEELAWPESKEPVLPAADTSSTPPTTTPTADDTTPPAPATRPTPQVSEEKFPTTAPAKPVIASTTELEDLDGVLTNAVIDGVEELIVPGRGWNVNTLDEAGWDAGEWRGVAATRVTKGALSIIVRPAKAPWPSPEEMRLSLEDFYDLTADKDGKNGQVIGTSIAAYSVQLLRQISERQGKVNPPRWLLPDLEGFPEHGAVAQPAIWGKKNETDQYFDRVRSHLPAITQAWLAPLWYGEKYEHFVGADVPKVNRSITGMWRIIVPAWDSRLPSPVGGVSEGTDLWVTTELLRLYHSRNVTPQVIEAWIAPRHDIAALDAWATQVKTWLSDSEGRPAQRVPKRMYQALHARLTSHWGRSNQHGVYRPDWGWAIRDNAWCSTIRHAYRIADETGLYPTAVQTDALFYPAGTTPNLPLGDGLGQFRRKG